MDRKESVAIVTDRTIPRIAIVIGQLTHGGAERQCLELAKGLRDAGVFDLVVFCTSHHTEPYGELLTKAGIKWSAAPDGCLRGIGKLWWLVRNVRRSRCRLLFGMLHTGNVYAGLAALILRIPFVASIRSATREVLAVRLPSAFACQRAAAVVANSASSSRALQADLGVRHPRVAIIANSVRRVERSPRGREGIRRQLGIPLDALVVGTMGNLKAEKRASFFLAVCKYAHDTWRRISLNHALPHFIWLGDGPERHAVDTALAKLPDDPRSHVHFPGASLDVDSYLAVFDVFVLTSAYEGMPNALLEAMSAGLPCVATNVPGTYDVLNAAPDIGILADPGNPGRFAESLVALLSDSERMRIIGENARKHVREHHSLEEMSRRYCDVFRSVLEKDHNRSKPERRTLASL